MATPNPFSIVNEGIDRAFAGLNTRANSRLDLARQRVDQARTDALRMEERAFREQRLQEEREFQENLRQRQRTEGKNDSLEERLRKLKVEAAALGIETVGKVEEQLAREIFAAERALRQSDQDGDDRRAMTRMREQAEQTSDIALNKRFRDAGLDPYESTTLELQEAEARLAGSRRATEADAEVRATGQNAQAWLADPQNQPLVERYRQAYQGLQSVLNADRLMQLPDVSKQAVGQALVRDPEMAGLRLSPAALMSIRDGNWDSAELAEAGVRGEEAQRVIELATAVAQSLAAQGAIPASVMSAEARMYSPQVRALESEMRRLEQQSNGYLTYLNLPPVTSGTPGPTGQAPTRGEWPTPTAAPAVGATPGEASNPLAGPAPVAAPSVGAESFGGALKRAVVGSREPMGGQPPPSPMVDPAVFGPPDPQAMAAQRILELQATRGLNADAALRLPLGEGIARATGVQPRQIGASNLYTDPRTVALDQLASGDPELARRIAALAPEEINRIYLDAVNASHADPSLRRPFFGDWTRIPGASENPLLAQ